jgi:hypothetical protein
MSKIEINGRGVDFSSIELGGVNVWDAPDYADTYVEKANYIDGEPLDDEALDLILDNYPDVVYDIIRDDYLGKYENV